MAVRILRLIEYKYTDAEAAERDMRRWTLAVGTDNMTMKSAVLQDLAWTEPDPINKGRV